MREELGNLFIPYFLSLITKATKFFPWEFSTAIFSTFSLSALIFLSFAHTHTHTYWILCFFLRSFCSSWNENFLTQKKNLGKTHIFFITFLLFCLWFIFFRLMATWILLRMNHTVLLALCHDLSINSWIQIQALRFNSLLENIAIHREHRELFNKISLFPHTGKNKYEQKGQEKSKEKLLGWFFHLKT